jgi:two-component system alkaline phosphatase synthesis response regulator PhoP
MDNTSKIILLVEDDLFLLDVYTQFFTQRGYHVISATDGEEGINKLLENKYYFIILDIMLPKKTGIDILKEIKKEGSTIKDTPVFMLTAVGYDEIIKQAFQLGANGYFLKSSSLPNQIIDEVESTINNSGSTIQQ